MTLEERPELAEGLGKLLLRQMDYQDLGGCRR